MIIQCGGEEREVLLRKGKVCYLTGERSDWVRPKVGVSGTLIGELERYRSMRGMER